MSHPDRATPRRPSIGSPAALALLLAVPATAQEGPHAAGELLATGRYRECLEQAVAGVAADPEDERWHVLRLRALAALGECGAAAEAVDAALEAAPRDLGLHVLGSAVLRACGEVERSSELLDEVLDLARRYSYRYRDAEDQVAIGRALLLRGSDAREVLEGFFEPASREEPELVAPRVAIAELALGKHDYALAADELREALARAPHDADLHVLLARALESGDPEASAGSLAAALGRNPSHAGALLLVADNQLAADDLAAAERSLARVLAVDPGHPAAWAYRAVLAHLDGDAERERACRERALERWPGDPEVDHLIGRELSQKYRFAEGAACQRRALELDPDHVEARFALAQDLLRLGQEREGWQLAQAVLDDDPYNVVAYNLMVLHDVLQGYTTLERDGLVVRMEPREAEVYGERVLALLAEARDELGARYAVELEPPVVLELFREQKDFAIRTFGLPGGEGFLGVCFGDVVTMKSPASQGASPTSWEAVLWHEFAHVVTLDKTRNKMPRWLSEGISVVEERRRDPAWGDGMTPAWRARILAGGVTPVSDMGSAFLRPDGPGGLQFAYFQASMVVEHLIESEGFDGLLAVLEDLGEGETIARSLARRVAPAAELDARFEAWLRERAEAFAPEATWEPLPEEPGADTLEALEAWSDEHPRNLAGLLATARALVDAGRPDEAEPLLERALELCPETGGLGALPLLARVRAACGDEAGELEALRRWTAIDADDLPARRRLMELQEERADWEALLATARGTLAVQPMDAGAQRRRARAAEALARPAELFAAGRALLALEPLDPARVHYLLARAAADLGRPDDAKRHVLRALEEAPRFREAHALLLELVAREEEGRR